MIKISVVNIYCKNVENECSRTMMESSFEWQFNFLKEKHAQNDTIYVLPRVTDDFLIYKYFIKDNLDKNGTAIEGTFKTEINGFTFDYTVVNEFKDISKYYEDWEMIY